MECQNLECPLKEDCDDIELLHFRYDNINFVRCVKCETCYYCSQRCAQQDWFNKHQFECRAATQELPAQEVRRIEQSTPFIKDGFLIEGRDSINVEMAVLTLQDIEFVKTGNHILGKGSYGEVEMAKHKRNGKKIAVKKIDKQNIANKKIKATLLREVEIHKKLKHENIIRLYTSFEDENFIYLVLEYAAKGNLFYLIRNKKHLSEDEAFYFFIQTCAGIYFLHKNGLIHRDIKPENLLIGEDNILKICDFGWCVQANDKQQRNTFCGTLEYMAPEMIQNLPHNYTLDIWCLGILLYELVHGQAPFTGSNPREIGQKIIKKNITFASTCSKDYKDLVDKLLQSEPLSRIPLIKVFDHPWVRHFEEKYNLKNVKVPPSVNLISTKYQNPNKEQLQIFKNQNVKNQQIYIEEKKIESDSSIYSSTVEDNDHQVNLDLHNDEDVMKEIEDLVKPKRKKNALNLEGESVYDMCDQMLEDLDYLDEQLQKRESKKSDMFMSDQNGNKLSKDSSIKSSISDYKLSETNLEQQNSFRQSQQKQSHEKAKKSVSNIFAGSSSNRSMIKLCQDDTIQSEQNQKKRGYYEPIIEMRQTDKDQVDYDKIRKNFLSNFETFCDNIDQNIITKNEQALKQEVKEFVKVQKDHSKQYKENVQKKKQLDQMRNSDEDQINVDYDQQRQDENRKSSNKKQKEENDIWTCQRKKDDLAYLKNIPIGEKESQQWLQSRKIDTHLELDFLP